MSRLAWLVLVLVAVVAIGQFLDDEPAPRVRRSGTGIAKSPSTPQKSDDAAQVEPETLAWQRSAIEPAAQANLFPAHSWRPPPPPASPPPPPPKPVPPPLPFKFLGRLVEADGMVAFLGQGENPILARRGDTLLDRYRVDAVEADRIELTYLPLNEKQQLRYGGPR